MQFDFISWFQNLSYAVQKPGCFLLELQRVFLCKVEYIGSLPGLWNNCYFAGLC